MSSPAEQFYIKNYAKLLLSATKMARTSAGGKDAVQQLYVNLRHLEPDKLAAIQNPQAYMYFSLKSIIVNTGIGCNRKSSRELEFQLVREFGVVSSEEAYDCMDKAYRLELVAEFSNTLPKIQKQVFTKLLQGLSGQETAQVLGNKYNTVKHNKRLIVEKLRKFFKQKGEEFNYGI